MTRNKKLESLTILDKQGLKKASKEIVDYITDPKNLLTELGKAIKAGKIKGNSFDYGCCHGFTNLYTGKTQGTYSFWKPEFKVDLHDGEITENKIDDNADTSDQDDHEKPTK